MALTCEQRTWPVRSLHQYWHFAREPHAVRTPQDDFADVVLHVGRIGRDLLITGAAVLVDPLDVESGEVVGACAYGSDQCRSRHLR